MSDEQEKVAERPEEKPAPFAPGIELTAPRSNSWPVADARQIQLCNVMVTEQGLVKVLDFGLAKLTEPPGPGKDEATRTLKPTTEEGTIVGTVSYMSPEQAEGKKVDARSLSGLVARRQFAGNQ